jgi:fermentation-respiration switch protein FrsA (DUF1100 family)
VPKGHHHAEYPSPTKTTPDMLIKLAAILTYLLLALLLAGASIWWMQPRMLVYPIKPLQATPADWGMDYDDVQLTAEDGTALHGWLIRAAQGRKQRPSTLLFLHGNAGNISHRRDSIAIFTDLGLDVLIIDYRGFGRSEGSVSESGLYQDAAAAWRWLTQTGGIPADDIVIFGRSLGGAVAAQLAAQLATQTASATQPAALIVESSFDHLQSLAEEHYPLLSHLIPLRYRFAAAEHIAAVRSPVLVLHSPDDRIVPYRLGQRLFAAATAPKAFVDLRGGHNDGFLHSQPQYQEALANLLNSLAVETAASEPASRSQR